MEINIGGKIVFKKEYLAKLLIVFGIATLVTALVNIIAIVIPLDFKVVKSVYLLSGEIAEKCIFPILGILAIVGGTYLCETAKEEKGSKCKCAVWAKRVSAVICAGFFAGLVTVSFVYAFNISALQNDIKNQIKGEGDKAMGQMAMMIQQQPGMKQENIQAQLKDLEQRITTEQKRAKKEIIINSIKILVSLISFAIVYLVSAIYLVKMSASESKECCESCGCQA